MGRLDELDLSLSLSKKEEKVRLEEAGKRLATLRLALGGKLPGYEELLGPPVLALFEGWDASGKGGAIKRLVAPLDPRHVRVAAYSAPTPDEKRHHFLWRFWPALPGDGGMAILDRTWYGRVLVERVEGFATTEEWGRAYGEIVDHERSLSTEGMLIVKFWLHVSDEEQLERFNERKENPLKSWKLTDEDFRNREKRPEYEQAIEDMLSRTDHGAARWQLVEAESKHYARVKVMDTMIAEIERAMREADLPCSGLTGEQGEVRLALASEHAEVDLGHGDAARLGERAGLGLDHLGGQNSPAAPEARRLADPLEVAGELLHGLDRGHALDLHGHVLVVVVAAHQVHRADVRRPLPPHQPQPLAAPLGRVGEQLLELALHALLLERGRLAHVVDHVREHLGDADLEPILGASLPDRRSGPAPPRGWWAPSSSSTACNRRCRRAPSPIRPT